MRFSKFTLYTEDGKEYASFTGNDGREKTYCLDDLKNGGPLRTRRLIDGIESLREACEEIEKGLAYEAEVQAWKSSTAIDGSKLLPWEKTAYGCGIIRRPTLSESRLYGGDDNSHRWVIPYDPYKEDALDAIIHRYGIKGYRTLMPSRLTALLIFLHRKETAGGEASVLQEGWDEFEATATDNLQYNSHMARASTMRNARKAAMEIVGRELHIGESNSH